MSSLPGVTDNNSNSMYIQRQQTPPASPPPPNPATVSSLYTNKLGVQHDYSYVISTLSKYSDNDNFQVVGNTLKQVSPDRQVTSQNVTQTYRSILPSLRQNAAVDSSGESSTSGAPIINIGVLKKHVFDTLQGKGSTDSTMTNAANSINKQLSMFMSNEPTIFSGNVEEIKGQKGTGYTAVHNGVTYKGEMRQNAPSGGMQAQGADRRSSEAHGTMNTPNMPGRTFTYVGEVSAGKFDGHGELRTENNTITTEFTGTFSNMAMNQGSLKTTKMVNNYPDTKVESGRFENDRLVDGTISLNCQQVMHTTGSHPVSTVALGGIITVKPGKPNSYLAPNGEMREVTKEGENYRGNGVFINLTTPPYSVQTWNPNSGDAKKSDRQIMLNVYAPESEEFTQVAYSGAFDSNLTGKGARTTGGVTDVGEFQKGVLVDGNRTYVRDGIKISENVVSYNDAAPFDENDKLLNGTRSYKIGDNPTVRETYVDGKLTQKQTKIRAWEGTFDTNGKLVNGTFTNSRGHIFKGNHLEDDKLNGNGCVYSNMGKDDKGDDKAPLVKLEGQFVNGNFTSGVYSNYQGEYQVEKCNIGVKSPINIDLCTNRTTGQKGRIAKGLFIPNK